MERLQLIFSDEVMLEDEKNMKLDYCLTEKTSEEDPVIPCFGIQITKYLGDIIETEKVAGISYSKDTVMAVIKKLFQFKVTPISMIEIVDGMITEGI